MFEPWKSLPPLSHKPKRLQTSFARAVVSEYRKNGNYTEADLICKTISLPDHGGVRGEACIHELLDALAFMSWLSAALPSAPG